MPIDDAVPAAALRAHRRFATIIAGLTDAQVGEPSALPGWTRGHVLSHVANVTTAMAVQAENEGVEVEVYPGGRPARDAAIEAGAGRSASGHRAAVEAAVARLAQAWSGVRDWSSRVAFRDGTLLDTAHALWREVEIHAFDLDLTPVRWSPEFCGHAVDFLRQRVPDGVRLTLAPVDDSRRWTIGSGEPAELTGNLHDLVAWLAGREPAGALSGRRPALNPWP
ncbi:maleylpyruvate isomerase family mycothiol-dependent enzyme [Saccharothrix algeriensis]|uniref:Maleylpyruvate isomerase n=1 Tax=Saccharothrix algeriensis TaxID=173560 RepID=A0A8T8I1H3_9PSEU|nr:maleylpyruvate isomerase family mycothiol-dependent enzyme [Saccharothrix algeriensis]MBM7810707.1 maleylpyruvate isomerase [Saccharothrix algeriensis]QTR04773.1 maleylpyruvate isomerase family mycothiol-dependent enzyme [Saccharothrix algeriensis]